ncbi:MAG TPA: shikimate dehydrogenase [Candidatus Methylomirabilis sp.]|nr:shikimate dehydrogenase [Candidatus Methylomirabilis sp.]
MAENNTIPARYAVMGNPVAHSKSPRIHQLFAHQFGHHIEYISILVDVDAFPQAVEQFRIAGGKGLNITVPFKLDAFTMADRLSDRARLAGAVNTLLFEPDSKVFGDNTDGTGLVHDIEINLGIHLRGKQILILGAGGAVRGVLGPILKHHPAKVMIANRTVSKARELVVQFREHGPVEACGYPELKGKHFDIVINGTSAGLKGQVPPLPETLFTRGALAYDMMYGDKPTAFLDWAMLHGANQAADGLGMLVEQAAESYFLWHGVRPDTRPVIAALRKSG